jgi:hypothetical protein
VQLHDKFTFKGNDFDQATRNFGNVLVARKQALEQLETVNKVTGYAGELIEGSTSFDDGDPRTLLSKVGIRAWMDTIKQQTEQEIAETEKDAAQQFWAGDRSMCLALTKLSNRVDLP